METVTKDLRVKGYMRASENAECEIEVPNPFCLVIFGASGDLTRRKIIPSIYRLQCNGLLPEGFFVIGAARSQMTDEEFREGMQQAVKEYESDEFSSKDWDRFAERLSYCRIDYGDIGSYREIIEKLEPLEKKYGTGGSRIFYLAIPPDLYDTVITNIGASGLSKEEKGHLPHVVIEKPFGWDTESARKLNATLREYFEESQIYRIDHYLAKETVQNILVFRFANSIFEPLWNRRYIDHVQITVAESIGVGHRGGYYEHAGVLRDMFQNHLFQLLALTAMEPPSRFETDMVRDEKVKVFHSMRPLPVDRPEDCVAIGQYGSGTLDGEDVIGYRGEDKVNPASNTPTFAALKVYIDNWRWNGVPFYLRSGKRLSKRRATISVQYKHVPFIMFAGIMDSQIEPSTLELRVQPDEGIDLEFQAKRPGARLCLDKVIMNFSYPKVFSLEAYERVLLDCMQGDQMLFVRQDGVDATWRLLTPLIEKLESEMERFKFPNYAAGSEGPVQAARLIEADGRRWRPI